MQKPRDPQVRYRESVATPFTAIMNDCSAILPQQNSFGNGTILGMQSAGLIFDNSPHYVDHLAPFCALQGWPLMICESAIADLARRYYPDLEVIEANHWELSLPSLVACCSPRLLLESTLGRDFSGTFFWLPHGNSDKGWTRPSFEALTGETALVYGQKMIDFMKKKEVLTPTIRIGNFRLAYWKRHQTFYNSILAKEISLPPGKKTFLYAPTWNDAEGNGTFWPLFPILANHLPQDCNLIVKLHPNTYIQKGSEIEQLVGQYEKQKNIIILLEFSPIYPLLDLADAYIGDMSSIGYDFLYWNRPMFFFNTKKETSPFLHRCGFEILPEKIDSIFHTQDDLTRFKHLRAQIYDYTFDRSPQYWN